MRTVASRYRTLSLLSPSNNKGYFMPADKLSDYGQETFTAAQIKAYRKQDEQARKNKNKVNSKPDRIRTK